MKKPRGGQGFFVFPDQVMAMTGVITVLAKLISRNYLWLTPSGDLESQPENIRRDDPSDGTSILRAKWVNDQIVQARSVKARTSAVI